MKKNEDLVCPICGAPTRVYMGHARKDRLCGKHADEFKAGILIQCENCGKWHYINEPCSCEKNIFFTELPIEGFENCVICNTPTNGHAFCKKCWKKYSYEEMLDILNNSNIIEVKDDPEDASGDDTAAIEEIKEDIKDKIEDDFEPTNKVVVIDMNNRSRCIICGRPSDGLLFCPHCYGKYKNKELLFQVTKCSNVELLDENYEGRYTCKDGHVVKSKSERDIDNYLFEHRIQHAYEKEVPYGPNKKDIIHPDFYLPHYLGEGKHVYLEHWGFNENNMKYTKSKKFKMEIYKTLCKEENFTLINTTEKDDASDIDSALKRKLTIKYIKENEINN